MKMDVIAGSGNDEFYTPVYAIKPIEKYLKEKSKILCPFDTEQSNFCKYLRKKGHEVICTHLSDGHDFFKLKRANVDYIVSNPPYSKKNRSIRKVVRVRYTFCNVGWCCWVV